MGFQKCHLSIFLFSMMILLHCTIFIKDQEAYLCGNNGNYTRNTSYQTNLYSILSHFPSQVRNTGFVTASIGIESDSIYASALCWAGLQLNTCRNCIRNATREILQYCPLRREAILWKSSCTVRYSNESFFGIGDVSTVALFQNIANVSDFDQFNTTLMQQLNDLRDQAAAGDNLIKVAASSSQIFTSNLTIYSYVQCTPDINSVHCEQCLDIAIHYVPQYFTGSAGARVLLPSCVLRYEIYPFFNLTRILEVQGLLNSSPPPITSPAPQPSPEMPFLPPTSSPESQSGIPMLPPSSSPESQSGIPTSPRQPPATPSLLIPPPPPSEGSSRGISIVVVIAAAMASILLGA